MNTPEFPPVSVQTNNGSNLSLASTAVAPDAVSIVPRGSMESDETLTGGGMPVSTASTTDRNAQPVQSEAEDDAAYNKRRFEECIADILKCSSKYELHGAFLRYSSYYQPFTQCLSAKLTGVYLIFAAELDNFIEKTYEEQQDLLRKLEEKGKYHPRQGETLALGTGGLQKVKKWMMHERDKGRFRDTGVPALQPVEKSPGIRQSILDKAKQVLNI